MKRWRFLALAGMAAGLVGAIVARADDNPGNQYQRFRFPWLDDGTVETVTQSVNEGNHVGSIAYAIDWGMAYNTFVAATGQGQVTIADPNQNSAGGFGRHVVQAVSTSGYGTKYILYGHLCSLAAYVGQTLYQGEYVGRSGNTGTVLPPPPQICNPSYPQGMHLHFQFDNTSPPSNSWQWTSANGNPVSLHSATQASLPDYHSSHSNSVPPGAYTNLTTDSFIHDSYVNRGGLNYGSTKALDGSQYTPCGVSTRWVHGCSLGSWGGGIAQTWESPEGYQKALIRRSNYTGVYSVQRSILYAFHVWANTLGYPTGDESGSSPITQYFNGGRITKTTTPCQTNVYNGGGQLIATYSICN